MSVHIHNVEQGTDAWMALRCGKITASTMSNILTPNLKTAANDKSRAFLNILASQRISGVIEDSITTETMLRGHIDEGIARQIYADKYAPVTEAGFITNDRYPGLGYSPDGLVGDDGLIEVKSRAAHHQIKTILMGANGEGIPPEYMAQIQTGLMVSEREWCDFISFSHGLPMMVARVFPDQKYIAALEASHAAAEVTVREIVQTYQAAVADEAQFTPTQRIDYEGMIL